MTESTVFTTHRIISPVFPEMTEALCECGNVATTTQELFDHLALSGVEPFREVMFDG